METFKLTLQIIAALIIVIALLHGALGHGAETLIGISVPDAARTDPSQDSQNRFFGLAFGLYGWCYCSSRAICSGMPCC